VTSIIRNDFPTGLKDGFNRLGHPSSDLEIERLATYLDLLKQWNRIHNFTGFAPEDWIARIVLESAGLLRFFPVSPGALNVIDFGSGAGIPGLVLAILRSEDTVFLIESRRKRADFLVKAITACALDRVRVIAGRVETLSPDRLGSDADIIVARAFGSIDEIVRLGSSILGPNGRLILPRGTQVMAEAARFRTGADGTWTIRIEEMRIPGIQAPQAVAVIERVNAKGDEWRSTDAALPFRSASPN